MQVPTGETQCWACAPPKLAELLLTRKTRDQVLGHFKALGLEQQRVILDRLPADARADFEGAAATSARRNCPGRPGEPCIFRLTQQPGMAQLHGKEACWLCGPAEKLDARLATGLDGMHWAAAKLSRMGPAARAKALAERVPERFRRKLQALCQLAASAGAGAPAAQSPYSDDEPPAAAARAQPSRGSAARAAPYYPDRGQTGALAAPTQPAAPRPELPAAEAAAPAAEAAAAAEPPAAEAAAPAAAAAAPPAAAAAAAAEAQASDPRPPFDAASSPPFKCFYPDCTATRNTYLGLMRHLKAKHCKVVSDFDDTFFADQVRAQKAEENDSRIARAAESAEAAAGASAAGASGAAPPARPATQARARVSQRAAAAGVVSKVKQELAEEENAEEGKMNAPVGRLQLLPRPPPQIFAHADQPKRKQLTLEQTIVFSRSLATDEKQRPAAAGEPPVDARKPHVKVCQDDQASIWEYQSKQRHGSKHFPLTEKAMKFLVSEYRARYGAATAAPNNTDMTEIIAKGQIEEVKCLGEEVVVDQVRNFYRQFLKLAAARSSHPAPRTA